MRLTRLIPALAVVGGIATTVSFAHAQSSDSFALENYRRARDVLLRGI
jgi:hypothetical protein